MSRSTRMSSSFVLMSIALVAGCSWADASNTSETPAAPTMPSGWVVVLDQSFEPADIKPVSDSLGAQVAALRNTTYEVNGKPVKLNTIVGASTADADTIMKKLRGMKPDDFIFRDGLTIYEFVGKNNAIPEMRAGKAHLQAQVKS